MRSYHNAIEYDLVEVLELTECFLHLVYVVVRDDLDYISLETWNRYVP